MFEVKNFDNWIEDIESGKFGSGAKLPTDNYEFVKQREKQKYV